MEILNVKMDSEGNFLLNNGSMAVPDDMGNRHRRKVQAWIDAGNTPTPYVAPVKTWSENRQENYPTIEELVVALYDTDDKAAIEKRRSDVKAKYPKPS